MLGIRYNSDDGRHLAARITKCMRNAAYRASIELAEKAPFPSSKPKPSLQAALRAGCQKTSVTTLLDSACATATCCPLPPQAPSPWRLPTTPATASSPRSSWSYNRKKRLADGGHRYYEVADHAWRLYRHMGFDMQALPPAFVTALDMSALDHMKMLEAVQPFIDTSISKTVNVPADYPTTSSRTCISKAGKPASKAWLPTDPIACSARYSPSTNPPMPRPQRPMPPQTKTRCASYSTAAPGRSGNVTAKIVLQTFQGNKTVYLTVNFMRVTGVVGGQEITIERPVEFFMPAGQRDDGQQWITSTMRLLSSVARSGGSVAKTLESLREVVWDKGQVRCGVMAKEDGTQRPMFHDSEVAAIGYALQQILMKRGFLDAAGNQVPLRVLAERLAQQDSQFNLLADPSAPQPQTRLTAKPCSAWAKVPGMWRQRTAQGRWMHALHQLRPHWLLRLSQHQRPSIAAPYTDSGALT